MDLEKRDRNRRLRSKQDKLVKLVSQKLHFGENFEISDKEFAPSVHALNLAVFPEWELEIDEAISVLEGMIPKDGRDQEILTDDTKQGKFMTQEELNSAIDSMTGRGGEYERP